MADDPRVQRLLDEIFDSGRTPEEVCRECPELLTEVRLMEGRFMASEPHFLDQGPEPTTMYDLDLTPWLDSPSVRELVGYIREVSVENEERGESENPAP